MGSSGWHLSFQFCENVKFIQILAIMVLYIVGLGLGDEKDITVRGLEAVKTCERLYLEFYTSILGIDNAKLEAFYGIPVVMAESGDFRL